MSKFTTWPCLAVLAAAAAPAFGFTQMQGISNVCGYGSNNCFGDYSEAGVPSGPVRTTSVSHGWSYVPTTPGSDSYSFGASASIAIDNAATWRASAQAGGYYNSTWIYGAGGASASAVVNAIDEITAQPTATWNTTGILRFTFRYTGSAFVEYSGPPGSTPAQSSASANLTFACSTGITGFASAPCHSPDLPDAPSGSYELYGSLALPSGDVDRTVSFDLFVQAGQTYNWHMVQGVAAGIGHLNLEGTTTGRAELDFMHTGRLVGVQLFDGAGNLVPDMALTSGSGFDYVAAASAVPEPGTLALFAAGALTLWARRPRRG